MVTPLIEVKDEANNSSSKCNEQEGDSPSYSMMIPSNEDEPVIRIKNSNRDRNIQTRRRERIQRFAMKKQKDSIQTKLQAQINSLADPFEPQPTLNSEERSIDQVVLNEKERLEHLKKMTDRMWDNIFEWS